MQPDRLVAIGLAVALAATLLALKRSLDKLGAASASQQSPGPGSAFAAAMEVRRAKPWHAYTSTQQACTIKHTGHGWFRYIWGYVIRAYFAAL